MSNTLFPKTLKRQARSKLESTTLRGFGGGLDAINDELSMRPNYLSVLKNFHRTSSGSQRLRFGTFFFQDIAGDLSFEVREDSSLELREDGGFELREGETLEVANATILDMEYFNARLIVVTTAGYIVTVSGTGDTEIIWSPAHAADLPGAPTFWTSGLELITFVPYKNELIIHNGVDKPITISDTYEVTYLQDLGTGSNANTPIGKYGCVAANYHCVAGFENSPTEIVISSKATAGTFPLDPDPNDAISIDVGAYAPEGASAIRGIAGYRSFLIVFLQGISLIVKLGVYDEDGNHTPEFPDTFPTFGLIGSRCIEKVETDLMFAGIQNLTNASRSVQVQGQLDSNNLSSIIEPLYQGIIGNLTEEQKQLNSFSVYDPLAHNLMLFFPTGSSFIYTTNEKLKYKGWSQYEGINWTCGCTSTLGRVYLAIGSKIYQLGNSTFGEKYYAEKALDRDTVWTTVTAFTAGDIVWDSVTEESYRCKSSHVSRSSGTFAMDREANPAFWEEYVGESIDFDFETPWFDGRDPMKVKKLRFVSIGSKGTAEFTLEAYVDNLYKDFDGNVIHDPALSMAFVGNDAPGFGEELEDGPFGSGRRSRDPRLFEFPVKFKTIKFRIFGSATRPLEIVNFSYLFARGSYFR